MISFELIGALCQSSIEDPRLIFV